MAFNKTANKVLFGKGKYAAYEALDSKVKQNLIYFDTDNKVVLLNNTPYGLSSANLALLLGSLSDVKCILADGVPVLQVTTNAGATATVSLTKLTDYLVGTDKNASSANTIYGAKKYAEEKANAALAAAEVTASADATSKANQALADAKSYTDTAIQNLDNTDAEVAGQFVTAVKEDNGIVTVERKQVTAAVVPVADEAGHFTADNVEGVLAELYSKAGDGSKVTVEETAGTEANVLKVYTVKQGGTEVGKINIPKDLVVTSGSVVKGNWAEGVFTESETGTGTALKLVIANQSAPVYINTLDLVKDHTAGNGIAISDTNVVSVVVDPASEFLSVGASGVKVSGVKTFVSEEIGKLDSSKSSEANAKAVVTVVEENGVITSVALEDKDIASATLLGTAADASTANTAFGKIAKEVEDRKTAINGLNADVTSTSGTNVNVQVVETAGKVTSVVVSESGIAQESALNAEIAARKAVTGQSGDTYAKHTDSNYIGAATSLHDADKKLDTAIKANANAIAAETTARENAILALDLAKVGDTGKVITSVSQSDGKVSAEAIDLKAANVAATAISKSDASVAVEGETVEAQITSLAKSIKTVDDQLLWYEGV